MLTALMVALAYLSMYSVIVSLIIPAPLILLVIRHGFRTGALVAVVSGFVSALVLSSPLMAVNLLITGIIGIALGMGLREQWKFTPLLLIGTAAGLIALGLRVWMYSLLFGENLLAVGLAAMEAGATQWVTIYESLGLGVEQVEQMEELAGSLTETILLILPLGLAASAVLQAYINLFLVRLLVRRLPSMPGDVPWVPPFRSWKWPWYFVWGFILVRLLMLVLSLLGVPADIWERAAINLDLFFVYLFFIQGLAIMWYYFDHYKVGKFLRILLVVFLVMAGGVMLLFVALVGILDTWFDFRRRLDQKDKRRDVQ